MKNKTSFTLFFIFIFSLASLCCSAGEKDPGWDALIEGAVSTIRGNSNYTEYRIIGAIDRRIDNSVFLSKLIYNRTKSNNELIINSILLKNELEYKYGDSVGVFCTADYERDLLRNVELRANSFYGVDYTTKDMDNVGRLKTGVGVEYEDIENDSVKVETAGRSAYSIHYTITDKVDFETSMEVTYKFIDIKDFRLLKDAYIRLGVTKNISVKTGFEANYRNVTPNCTNKWDTKFITSIVLSF